jgi:hypothetical protein
MPLKTTVTMQQLQNAANLAERLLNVALPVGPGSLLVDSPTDPPPDSTTDAPLADAPPDSTTDTTPSDAPPDSTTDFPLDSDANSNADSDAYLDAFLDADSNADPDADLDEILEEYADADSDSDSEPPHNGTIMAKPEDYQGYYRPPLSSLAAPYQHGSNWYQARENFLTFPPARSKRDTKGPRSMMATCMRVLADNIADVSRESLLDLPDKLRRALFRELYPRNMPLHAWRALSPAFFPDPSEWEQAEQLPMFEKPVVWRSELDEGKGKGKEKEVVQEAPFNRALAAATDSAKAKGEEAATTEMGVLRFSLDIGAPQCRLSTYITPFMDWTEDLIYFCIDNITRFQTHELIPLAKLPRLAVLEIVERQKEESLINDRLFRGWAEGEGERFPALRVLKIGSRSHQVSEKSLQYALSFPSLEIFDIIALPSSGLRSDEAKDIADRCGWKVDEAGGNIYRRRDGEVAKSLFVSYAEAYLDGRMPVHKVGVLGFKKVFDNDKQEVVWVDSPRRLLYAEREKGREMEDEKTNVEGDVGHVEAEPEKPDLCDYTGIDEGWRTLLQGTHPLSRLAKFSMDWNTNHYDMTKDQVFWFLALLDQCQEGGKKQPAIQRQATGVTLPGDRFVTFTLCDAACGSYDDRYALYQQRLIFSRSRDAEARRQRVEAKERSDPAPSWAPRPDDRREENLRAPKRQKRSVGDLLSSVTG